MQKLLLLDLYCGAGGAAMGYHRAGFDVVGVDIKPQKHYPFPFVQGDALRPPVDLSKFDAIHASPPCQAYTAMQHIKKNSHAHQDLVEQTRFLLKLIGVPYVIENVPGAPLNAELMLCGTMFGLRIIRHRYFEVPWMPLSLLPHCDHRDVFDPWHGRYGPCKKAEFNAAMGIDWMDRGGGGNDGKSRVGTIDQAIPPAYTEFIGRELMNHIRELSV